MSEKLKEKIIRFLKQIWKECGNKRTIALFAVVLIIMYAPVWGGYLLWWLFRWKWCAYIASAYMLFWAGPFTPFFPLCLAVTLALTRLVRKKRKPDLQEGECAE